MPSIQTPQLNPNLMDKSEKLQKIYELKDQIEKQYGDKVKSMSPVREINRQY
jgi:hypothetical protein